jgi:O-antigen/teichoic acid export membrane protein
VFASEVLSSGGPAAQSTPLDLKGKTARGVFVATVGQAAVFFLRTGSMVVLARLLSPVDFGIVGMVTACTGFLELFRDMGLSVATIQRASVTRVQTSMLFWVNLAAGWVLAALCAASAPLLVLFFQEPRLLWPTVVLGMGFIFNGAAVQHRAMLARDMRFGALAAIDIISVVVSIAVGVAMAVAQQSYWALVGMYMSTPLVGFLGVWVLGGWVPVAPQRGTNIRPLLRYGSTLTLKNVVLYLTLNTDKVLLGRFWGADALGVYGRAYQLISLPTQNLTSTIGQVAVPALSRLQNDPKRLKNYFLKGYGLLLSMVVPITLACALFAKDIIMVFLGPKWGEAVPLFQLLAPTILALGLVSPLTWLLLAVGNPGRTLRIALLTAPVVIAGYAIGLHAGPNGVAAGFSVSTILLAAPVVHWAMRGTVITSSDVFKVVLRPLFSAIIAAAGTLAVENFTTFSAEPLVRLTLGGMLFFGVYALLLFFVMGQKDLYISLLRQIGVFPIAKVRSGRKSLQHSDV